MIGKPGKHVSKICGLIIVSALIGCNNYSVSLNDKVVYTPPELFKDFVIADTHLSDCVTQTILDNHITKVEQLKQLNCSHAGISNLTGLEKFSAIEQLNLAENAITSVSALSNLAQLQVLILRKNNLINAEPLLHLLHLRELDISENEKLGCGEIKQLLANFHKGDLKTELPEQCKVGAGA
jgi:Leucine-rich repeat (LRR) protein